MKTRKTPVASKLFSAVVSGVLSVSLALSLLPIIHATDNAPTTYDQSAAEEVETANQNSENADASSAATKPEEFHYDYPALDDAMVESLTASDGYAKDEILVIPEGSEEADVVKLPAGQTVRDALKDAANNPTVRWAQPNFTYQLMEASDNSKADETAELTAAEPAEPITAAPRFIPNDPQVQSVTPSSNTKNAWQLKSIRAFDAWDKVKTEGRVTVAVIDTGCRLDHEDLKNQLLTDLAWDAYGNVKLTRDTDTHGTHVAGIIAAQANNGLGTAGSSYNAKILPVNVFNALGSTDTGVIGKAINYVLDKAKENPSLNVRVINMSLGGYDTSAANDNYYKALIAKALSQGIVCVAAGGNGDADHNPITKPSYPSDYEDVISVTALSADGKSPTSWCDYNQSKDICAPGDTIWSTLPGLPNSTDTYGTKSGTSMATPVVSGALALLWAAYPNLTVAEAKQAIYNSAKPLTVVPGREGLYGHGRLDIASALEYLGRPIIGNAPAQLSSGQSVTLSCSAGSNQGPAPVFTWSVQNTVGSATINSTTGKLTAVLPGKVKVTVDATQAGASLGSASVDIEIVPLALQQAPKVITIPAGFKVRWPALNGALGYHIERASSANGPFAAIGSAYAPEAVQGFINFQDTYGLLSSKELKAPITYYYRVKPFAFENYKEETGLWSSVESGIIYPAYNTIANSVADSMTASLNFLKASGSEVSTVIVTDTSNAHRATCALTLAAATNGIVWPVSVSKLNSIPTQAEKAAFASIEAKQILILGTDLHGSSPYLDRLINTRAGTVTKLGQGTTSPNSFAAEVSAEYKSSLGDTAIYLDYASMDILPQMYNYVASIKAPVFVLGDEQFDDETAMIKFYGSKYSNAIFVGEQTQRLQGFRANLQAWGVSCSTLAPGSNGRYSMAQKAVTDGRARWTYLAFYPETDSTMGPYLQSVMALAGGIALGITNYADAYEQLVAIKSNTNNVAFGLCTGSSEFLADLGTSVEKAVMGSELAQPVVPKPEPDPEPTPDPAPDPTPPEAKDPEPSDVPANPPTSEDKVAYSRVPMYRLYNKWSGEHFYTSDIAELASLCAIGWRSEGIGWYAPGVATSAPVYRLYNKWSGDHHYTLDPAERNFCISAGWTDEGIGWYSDENKTVPVFREYNPYVKAFYHNYTADYNEHKFLTSIGWLDESIGWYGC